MTCREFADFIADYEAGELGDGVRASFERHLQRCPNCRAYLALYLTTVALERSLAADENAAASVCGVPDDLVSAILDARERQRNAPSAVARDPRV
jgi:anti-sigma factor RsiW